MANVTDILISEREIDTWSVHEGEPSLFYEDDIEQALVKCGIPKREAKRYVEIGTLKYSKGKLAIGLFVMDQCICWVSAVGIVKTRDLTRFYYKCTL